MLSEGTLERREDRMHSVGISACARDVAPGMACLQPSCSLNLKISAPEIATVQSVRLSSIETGTYCLEVIRLPRRFINQTSGVCRPQINSREAQFVGVVVIAKSCQGLVL